MAKSKREPARTPLVATTFRLPADILAGLADVKARDGTPIAQQVQRALRAWLEQRGPVKSGPRRKGVMR